jgi:hypothetical protein
VGADTGAQRFVYVNGKAVNGADAHVYDEGARYKTADYDAQMRRHTQLLRRQHFMDRK